MSQPIEKVVIVGGGTAGWMTAAALSRLGRNNRTTVTLVESEAIGTVGVGEATIPTIQNFNKLLGINEAEFMAATQATFKLGIEFANWGRKGEAYLHPFGNYGLPIEAIPFYQFWLKRGLAGDTRALDNWSLPCMAARNGTFMHPDKDPRSVLSTMSYAYQFDATLYAAYLRNHAEQRGVKRIEGRIVSSDLNGENGHVSSITMENGEKIEGDLFVDCSGFGGLLIEQALKTGYEDWTHWLPMDRAVAVPCKSNGPILPYTRATAHDAGWQWRIPLQHRTGNGHVYCSDFISDDEAASVLLGNLDGAPFSDPKFLRFKTGRRKKFWNKNVVAIGLAAGFMEPLESTSIHLVQTGISKLLALFPTDNWAPVFETEYNRLTGKEYARVRDFIILHYKATQRDDTPFWRHMRDLDIPDSLERKMELFKETGQIFREEDELFTDTSWVAVMIGQNIVPIGYDPLVDTVDQKGLNQDLDNMAKSIETVAARMPRHQEFLARYCPAQANDAPLKTGSMS